jgi:hypothetical protein
MLDCDEYIEQAFFFRALGERISESLPLQELLESTRNEILSTTKLPLAIDFLNSDLKHMGVMGSAMAKLSHYFTQFQIYIVQEAENDAGRFDLRVGLQILRHEAEYKAKEFTPQGLFMFQFETICRNRLRYDKGLDAISADPAYSETWQAWVKDLRRKIHVAELADLVYVRSKHYLQKQGPNAVEDPLNPILFDEKDGRIALANRNREPLLLFAALQRHLGYPKVPRPIKVDEDKQLVPLLLRRVERLETRMKLMEDEQRGGFDLSQFYTKKEDL